MNHWLRYCTLGLLLAALNACAPPNPENRIGAPRNTSNIITRGQIDGTNRANALEIIQSLRPTWLNIRGPQSFSEDGGGEIMVYYGPTQLGGIETLREITPASIERLEFIPATKATQRWGTGLPFGAILITPRDSH